MSKRHDGSPARDIPLPIQREVRQRCGSGCVICGLPFYEYDHMLGCENVKSHVADEITLLCRLHHGGKTSGLLPAAAVVSTLSVEFFEELSLLFLEDIGQQLLVIRF